MKHRTVHQVARDIDRSFAQAAREVTASLRDRRGTFIVTALFNETRGSRFYRFEPGVELVQSQYPVQVQAESPLDAAEAAYIELNADSRPNGQTERSVSIADLLHVHEVGGNNQIFIVERGVGMSVVTPEIQLSHSKITGDVIRLRAES